MLVDAGPLLAAVDRDDELHAVCVDTLSHLTDVLTTTWPAFAEAVHLIRVRVGWHGQELLWQMVRRGDLMLASIDNEQINRVYELMKKYRDVPMDLADATLVSLAEQSSDHAIFSFDRHFRIYRIAGRKRFHVIP